MDNQSKRLTVRQLKALQSLLTGASVQETALQLGMARQTIYHWLNDPAFSAALKRAEGEVMAGLTRSLVGLGERTVQLLSTLLENETLDSSQKIKAANVVLTHLLRLYEIYKLEERIARLEETLDKTLWSES